MVSNLPGLHRFTTLEALCCLFAVASHALVKRPRYAIAPTIHGPALIVVDDGKVRDIVVGGDEADLHAYRKRHAPDSAPAGSIASFWDVGVEVLIALDETAVPGALDQEAVGAWLGDAVLRRVRGKPIRSVTQSDQSHH